MLSIQNPILPGFHPDPSIIRVGENYYIATSTFQWFPGVSIHHSKDLVHWELIGYPLSRISQLDLRGVPCNYGVWAPCLSYDGGIFYLVYSQAHYMNNAHRDCHNYLVTAGDIRGPWSEPIHLKSDYADYSLFHDGDKKWLVFPHDYTDRGLPGRCIAIQEYDAAKQKTTGPIIGIFQGTDLGTTEGPHLYRKDGYYYLITAEGGTSFGHGVTVARARSLEGPYTVDPQNPMLTSRDNPRLPLQKSGHADLVQTQKGDWYMVHLCARPLPESEKCILGRETALQKVVWSEGWLRLAGGKNEPETAVEGPGLPGWAAEEPPVRDDFTAPRLDPCFQTLRIPLGEDTLSLGERPGFLRLKGKESLGSVFRQALVARRQEAFCCTASASLEFAPQNPLQSAGLVCYYNTFAYHYVYVTHQKGLGRCIRVLTNENDRVTFPCEPIPLGEEGRCCLRAVIHYEKLQFWYSQDGGAVYKKIGPSLDANILTDEFSHPGMMNFTGAFVGLCCQDLSGESLPADFDWFEYSENKDYEFVKI